MDDQAGYRQFRCLEPNLVSALDGKDDKTRTPLQVISIRDQRELMGVISFFTSFNARRPAASNRFARIDLVIVHDDYRQHGVGRLLVYSAIAHLLIDQRDCLYSISCLAAHDAIAKILEDVGFVASDRDGQNFIHEELKLDGKDRQQLASEFLDHTAMALQRTNYRLRQRNGTT